jgi:hypothetical protein
MESQMLETLSHVDSINLKDVFFSFVHPLDFLTLVDAYQSFYSNSFRQRKELQNEDKEEKDEDSSSSKPRSNARLISFYPTQNIDSDLKAFLCSSDSIISYLSLRSPSLESIIDPLSTVLTKNPKASSSPIRALDLIHCRLDLAAIKLLVSALTSYEAAVFSGVIQKDISPQQLSHLKTLAISPSASPLTVLRIQQHSLTTAEASLLWAALPFTNIDQFSLENIVPSYSFAIFPIHSFLQQPGKLTHLSFAESSCMVLWFHCFSCNSICLSLPRPSLLPPFFQSFSARSQRRFRT